MSGTISTTINTAVTLSVNPTTVTSTGAVDVDGAYYAIQGPSPTAWVLTNHGEVSSAEAGGVSLSAGGSVGNAATGTISANLDGVVIAGKAGTILNAGTVQSATADGIYLGAGGTITNAAAGSIASTGESIIAIPAAIVVTGGAGTVVNAGTISALIGDIALLQGGTVSNAARGLISAYYAGVSISGPAGSVINEGTIIAAARDGVGVSLEQGGSLTNGLFGLIVGEVALFNSGGTNADRGTVINEGTIHAGTSAYSSVSLADGTVRNAASGLIAGGTVGVALGEGSVANAGTISGAEFGVEIYSGGTVVDSGVIAGRINAVYFHSGYMNKLVLEPGAYFGGFVGGGNAIGSTITSTLELALGPGLGTLTNFSEFYDFADIVVDPGASWQLAGNNTVVAGELLTVDGLLSDPGTLSLAGTATLSHTILSAETIGVAAGATLSGNGLVGTFVTDDGLVEAAGGTLRLTGPIDLASTGTLIADAALLDLTGPGNVIARAIDSIGSGQIAFDGTSTSTIERGVHGDITHIDLFANASLALGTGLSGANYGGTFDDSSNGTTTFDPGANDFTLSGAETFMGTAGQADITGSGTLTLSGRTGLANATLGGSETLDNRGSLTETGQMTIGYGITPGAAVANSGTWNIANDAGISSNETATSDLVNSGIFEKTAGTGTSVIAANFVNDGTIIADSGTLEFTGSFTEHGTIIQNGGTMILMPAASPALFNQLAAGIDPGTAGAALFAPPQAPPPPTLAAPHAT